SNIFKVLLTFVLLVGILFAFGRFSQKFVARNGKEDMAQLENNIRKAVMLCYATEGVYPESIDYLKDHYGIQINEEEYAVFYEVQGKNLMPNITVMESQIK
ncbi:MAG: hypothetical protein K6G62_00445, partial [Eubacterium sp.]|nr:hypothetical protein [Eubacterium sp.]